MSTTMERELSIMARVVAPDGRTFSVESAKAILEMGFPETDRSRFSELVETASRRELTDEEQSEAETYRRVESWLVTMKSKARQSLSPV